MNDRLVSVDLAKNSFQLCIYSKSGKILSNRKIKRAALREAIAQIEPTQIVMEACYSANYWGRAFQSLGHTVQLIPAQHVKPFVRGNKTDANDAVAIAEASLRPRLRFVPVKTLLQQDIQLLHRVRERHVGERTALVNQIRGLLSEYGVVVSKGWRKLREQLPLILEDGDNELTVVGRAQIARLQEELTTLCGWIEEDNRRLEQMLEPNEDYHRLRGAPGFGPVLSSAVIAGVGNAAQFGSAREMAAWLGLTPRAEASGDRSVLKGISKRGNRYLRTLFIHGARAVVNWCSAKSDPLSLWLQKLIARRGRHKTIVAMAHKMARFAWAMLRKQQAYRAPVAQVA
jgi:transposase